MITQRLFRVYSTLIQRHSTPLLSPTSFYSLSVDALGSMAAAEVISPSITSPKQYLQYLRVLCSSLTAYIAFLRSFNQTSPDRLEIIYQRTIQILIHFPRESVFLSLPSHSQLASSDIALQILELLVDPKLNLTSLINHLPYLLTGDVLFPLQLSVCENSSLIEHRLQIVNDILLTRKNKLRLVDIQNIAYIYSFFFGNPVVAFRTLRRMTFSLTELVKSLRQYTVTQRDIVSMNMISNSYVVELLYRIALTFVRKVEDMQCVSQRDARIRDVKKACVDAETSNARFTAFMNNEPYTHPTPAYDEYGIRVTPSTKYLTIGDVEIKESRYNIISLLQGITAGMVEIVRFFRHPSPSDPALVASSSRVTSPTLSALSNGLQVTQPPLSPPLPDTTNQQPVDPLPFSERFVTLIYRYVIGVFYCGELFQIDETRSRDQLESRISNFAEVIRELPDHIARHVLSLTLPHIYPITITYPIFLTFFKSLMSNIGSFKYSSCIIIDFIANHLADLDCTQDSPPVLLTLFRVFCTQINIMPAEEAIFKPYLKRLLCECIQRLMITSHWSYYLDVLYGCLNIFQHNTFNELSVELNTLLRPLIYQMTHIIQVATDPHTKERVFEITYRVPLNTQQIHTIKTTLINFYVKGLAGPDTLQRSGNYISFYFISSIESD